MLNELCVRSGASQLIGVDAPKGSPYGSTIEVDRVGIVGLNSCGLQSSREGSITNSNNLHVRCPFN